MDRVHIYMCSHIASIKSTAGNKTRLFSLPAPHFYKMVSQFGRSVLERLRSRLCTALSSATEKKEFGGYVTVPCPPKLTQRSSAADWLKF